MYATGRFTTRTYLSASFTINRPESRDYGLPGRFAVKVFDLDVEPSDPPSDVEVHTFMTSPTGRVQWQLLVARDAGAVKELWIQRVENKADGSQKLSTLLNMKRDDSKRLIEFLKNLDTLPIEGEATVRIDDSLLREVLADPHAVQSIYDQHPDEFRSLVSEDESSRDLIALAHRREQLGIFRRLLNEEQYFEEERERVGGSTERVWQEYFERNPWVLGVGLTGCLMTAWNDDKLEQVVAGFSVAGSGKRSDALMRTAGSIQYMTFAEIKHHKTHLLAPVNNPYRPECWAPSSELSGGVVQSQQTVNRATREIGERLEDLADDGSRTGEATYLIRPRSFLIAGSLSQLRGANGGVHDDKNRSFELYRRNLYEPQILTFDEVLEQAEWQVALAESPY